MGLQSMAFFCTISWLPEILVDDGMSEGYAGTLSGVTQLVQMVPAFAIPVLAARARAPSCDLLLVIVGTALVGLLGVMLAPGLSLLWMVLLGIGQGGALGLGADAARPARARPRPGGRDDRDGDGRRLPDRRRRTGARRRRARRVRRVELAAHPCCS